MTEENFTYRTSQMMLRNQFPGEGPFKIPVIPKSEFSDDEFRDLRLIGFDRTRIEDENNLNWMVHFFLYDYKFERVWKEPDRDIERLRRYRAVLTPDFSMYLEMNPTIQLYNTFRNRWCGAYFQSKGLRVIPTVNWGDENTFDFCFLGVPKGSTVAVSTYMVSEHGNRCDQKEFFMKGYNEMLRRIEPERIVCYNTPFPEMTGNIVFVDYELSSWKYQGQCNEDSVSPYAKYISGDLPLPENCGIVIKQGYIMRDCVEKGSGSAYGGKWRPNPKKPYDSRFIGQPGEIKRTEMADGTIYETKIGSGGRAEMERHYTDHDRGHSGHTNPHDHMIDWSPDDGHPIPGPPINYPNGDIPEFKTKNGAFVMKNDLSVQSGNVLFVPDGTMNFDSISEFKQSLCWGMEAEFVWNGKHYGVVRYGINNKITIYECGKPKTDIVCENADEALEFMAGNDRLRDIITKVHVISRTI